ncbi:hypothetical protein CAPTEDRAFT_137609 [Capitella teleta]|uniref:C2H2-type domain-containing protein n=1 Tax=Capitella teleta TaxID=283909 RepID=R7UA05_CAPTE|nr:hypothetical protein CAPTEDRAFT_137609 [Capitella teleta]|eukprot:ELU02819.1 hypothetical protein CAPTEDRAFT_137609 [Capitella teleta]
MSALLNVDVKPVAEEVPRKRKKLGTGRPQKNKRFHQLKGTDGRYHCDFEGCEYSSAVLCNLVRHYRKHLDEKPFTCQKCGKSFKLKKYLTDHELTHSEERRFGCEVCGAQFRCDKHLSRHQKTHAVEKTHQCPEEGCTYKAFTARQLRKHSDSRHWEAILCETCGRSFLTQQSMKAHILAFHEQRFFQCPHCPFKSGFRTGITSHIKRKHGLTPSGAIAKPNYKCDQCEFACFTKHEFKRHTLNHLGEKPFKCTECDFATVEKMNLKFHMRTHTGEKPYECPICHRKFPRTLGLRRHMLVHSGQKPHKCSECSMAYADKRSLESHQYSTHLQIKPFLCPHCTYACIRRENLNRHIKRCHPVDQELKMDDSLLAVKQELNPPASEVCIEAATQQLHQVYANQLGAPINLVFGADHQLDTVQLVLQQQQQQQQQ